VTLRNPPLRDHHAEQTGKFTEFGGWDMPVEFDSITTEHRAVRESVGIFDVSHMGEIEVAGPDAVTLMQRLTTNDVTEIDPGEAQYTALVDEDGTLIDDTVVYRLPDDRVPEIADGDTTAGAAFLFVPNAGNDEDAHDRWLAYRDEAGLTATVRNATEDWAMFAVQGPDAPALVDAATATDLTALGRFDATFASVADTECLVARTGYTGEDGFEVLCPWEAAADVWTAFDAQPCGLGARDTLRIEQGFLLSGQDFHPDEEPRTPYEAGIGFAVDTDTTFVRRRPGRAVRRAGTAGPRGRPPRLRRCRRGRPRDRRRHERDEGADAGPGGRAGLPPVGPHGPRHPGRRGRPGQREARPGGRAAVRRLTEPTVTRRRHPRVRT